MIASSRKDSQIQDKIEQLKSKDTQQNTQNYEKIKDLIEQINKTKEQEIISLQNRLKNLTEVITNYRIETARKDGKIQDNIVEINDLKEQLKDKLINQETLQNRLENLTEVTTTQMNTKDTEIKDLRDQIKSTQSLSEKLNLTIDELATYKYTEQCPNFTTITFFQFKIRGINTFQARCAPSGWMVIQNRYDGSENFNRTWNEYKEGFGDISYEFFFGLEKLHLMTDAQTYELYIFLKDSNGNTSYAHYSDFKIGSEEESYRLKSLGKYSGTAGPALDHLLQSKFSTFDRETTPYIKGCAHSNGGGWWYKNCGTCALNGYYFRKPKSEGKLKFDIHWAGFRRFDSNITLTQTLMKIRPTTL
ncbi:hypothetical protein KR059_012577 [Drosophila kikkawai]|nr:hypothetical protein KR059_012577 [Drosophila kikkawai]